MNIPLGTAVKEMRRLILSHPSPALSTAGCNSRSLTRLCLAGQDLLDQSFGLCVEGALEERGDRKDDWIICVHGREGFDWGQALSQRSGFNVCCTLAEGEPHQLDVSGITICSLVSENGTEMWPGLCIQFKFATRFGIGDLQVKQILPWKDFVSSYSHLLSGGYENVSSVTLLDESIYFETQALLQSLKEARLALLATTPTGARTALFYDEHSLTFWCRFITDGKEFIQAIG